MLSIKNIGVIGSLKTGIFLGLLGAGATKTSQSPRRGRHNSDLADEHFLSNVVINNLDHIFADFVLGKLFSTTLQY